MRRYVYIYIYAAVYLYLENKLEDNEIYEIIQQKT